jgi:hypothetical protein
VGFKVSGIVLLFLVALLKVCLQTPGLGIVPALIK